MHTANGMDDHAHRTAGVPNAFQTMSTGADDDRRFLSTFGTILHRSDIVAHWLKGVEQVIEVLDFGDGAKASHGGTDAFTDDTPFADAFIGYSQFTIFLLHAGETLVYVANFTYVFTEGEYTGVALEVGIEAGSHHLVTVYDFIGELGGYFRYIENTVFALAVGMTAITFAVDVFEFFEVVEQGFARIGTGVYGQSECFVQCHTHISADGVFGLLQFIGDGG